MSNASDRTDSNTIAELEYDGGDYPFRRDDEEDADAKADEYFQSVIDSGDK